MCFSATASFSLSAVLAGLGATSIARSSSNQYRVFAATPFIFAAQQAAEGVVWLTMDDPMHAMANRAGVAAFLGLALVIWPMWLPAALRAGERDAARRRLLTAMLAFGALVSISALVLLTHSRPIAVVAGHSLRYDRSGSTSHLFDVLVLLAYFIPTVAPLFVSTVKLGRLIGATLVASMITAALIQIDTLTSVWCFFAAIVSSLVIVAVRQEERAGYASPVLFTGTQRE
jgi:hypothetical protein